METKVSVVFVCHNGEKYLSQALSAACVQTYINYEIIFIDDASNDSSLQIAKSILKNSKTSHKIIHLDENKGLASGRTRGIIEASGDYIIFNDHDDFMANNCLEVLANYADKGYDKIFSNIIFIDENDKKLEETDFNNQTSRWIIPHLQGVLLKKSLFVDNNIVFSLGIHMDDVTASGKLNIFSKKTIGISDKLFFMRIHEESMTHVKSWNSKSVDYLDEMLSNLTKYADSVNYSDADCYLEYYCMRDYYTVIMHCRRESYKEKKEHYNRLAIVLPKYFPDYLDNPIIKEPYVPKYDIFHKRIQMLVKAEQLDKKLNTKFYMYFILLGYDVFDRIGIYKHA